MTTSNSDLLNQQAAQYVAGSMTACEFAEWELLLTTDGSPESLATTELEGALLELTAGVASVEPPAQLKAGILERIATPKGFVFRFADDASFRPTPVAGITYRLLSRDHEHNRVTCLLRLVPGARLPAHTHPGKLQTALSRSRVREALLISLAVLEAVYLVGSLLGMV